MGYNKKKNKKDIDSLESLFTEDSNLDIDSGMEDEVVFINMDEIESETQCDVYNIFENLIKVYGNEAFMKEHPDYKKRIDIEKENLRTLIKMKKSDEIIHDILIKSIGKNSTNASLYSSLNKIQSSIMGIQSKLDETIKNLNNLLKNYQFEIPFKEEDKQVKGESNVQPDMHISRGRKAFIEAMDEEEKYVIK